MAIYIGRLVIDPGIVAKLNMKHQVTMDELRDALQWPARVHAAVEDHPDHGVRWLALGMTAGSREVLATLLPTPSWEGERADSWVVKTARWV